MDHRGRPGVARRRLRPSARVRAGRAVARSRAEDFLPPRARGDLGRDRFAAASAEVGTVFCAIVLTTGPIWGKPIWGTWWTWDARLTFTLFLFLLYVGYLLLRGAVMDPAARARFAAVLGICGMVEVPFIHLSVYMFPTLHPMPIVLKPGAPSLPWSMLSTWLFSLGVFTLLYVGFVVQRYALSYLREQLEAVGEVGHA
ncbi:MAG: hypothetical protein DMD66_01390 [Gemmatimonadetes bacterium]|nr:MAG: hypothetical protein DMD66_01390 [Gemmatimonadota bacterium]